VKKKKASSLVDKGVVTCYGCGAPLQTSVPAAAGYVAPDKFEAKKKHRQLQQVTLPRDGGRGGQFVFEGFGAGEEGGTAWQD
jgi:hypothetical protein